MKQKIIFMAIIAMLVGTFSSCKNDVVAGSYPVLYVVNGSDYSAKVYCDNHLVASADARNNSGKVVLSNTSINMPVYVEVVFYNNKGNRVANVEWNNYYFMWNKSYKLTLTGSGGRLQEL